MDQQYSPLHKKSNIQLSIFITPLDAKGLLAYSYLDLYKIVSYSLEESILPQETDLYKVILVDDEDEVRGRISSKISQESGFIVTGTAGNGHDALELIEEQSPNVVFTDIKMPFIDGIELAGIIRRDYPTIKIVFISGYDEFEYAREAIDLNVSCFLSKPLTQKDISVFLEKLKVEMDNEFEEKYQLEQLQKSFKESLPLLIDNYFTSALASNKKNQSQDIDNLKKYGISLDDEQYLVTCMCIKREEKNEDLIENEQQKLSLRSIVSKTFKRQNIPFYSFLFAGELLFILKKEEKENNDIFWKTLDARLYEITQVAEKFLSATVNIGVSELHITFSQLDLAYYESHSALEHSYYLNTGHIIYSHQLKESKPCILTLPESDIKQLEYALRFGTNSEIRNLMDSLKFNVLKENEEVANYRPYIINILNILVNFASFIGVDLNYLAGEDVLNKMNLFPGLEQVFDWSLSLMLRLHDMNFSSQKTGSEKIITKANLFIENNYKDSTLSMDTVCDHLGISVSYLSLLFKKHRENTFVKYLTSIRMERAKEQLKLTDHRITEIAQDCGFSDAYYFSHSFKKYTGQSPKAFRENENKTK